MKIIKIKNTEIRYIEEETVIDVTYGHGFKEEERIIKEQGETEIEKFGKDYKENLNGKDYNYDSRQRLTKEVNKIKEIYNIKLESLKDKYRIENEYTSYAICFVDGSGKTFSTLKHEIHFI